MQIKRITISGFKSYTSSVTIHPTMFTAITGLNGTGKSTVLDALLFVLMKTSKLRVKKVEELINSGSNEAFVEVVFGNINDQASQGTHEEICHLIVSGNITMSRMISKDKSKFLINGQSCTSTFFKQTISILIPYAHNTIMQGNITRFFSNNIKSIVNETAGITGYEENSKNTIEVIKKKEIKLCAAREALQRRISPFIEKLKSERSRFIEQRRCMEEKEKNKNLLTKGSHVLECNDRNLVLNEIGKLVRQYKTEKNECEAMDEAGKIETNELDIFELRKCFDEKNKQLELLNKKMRNCEEGFDHSESDSSKKIKIEKINKVDLEKEIDILRDKEMIISNEMKRRGLAEVGIRKHDGREKVKELDSMRKKKNENLCKINELSINLKNNGDIISKLVSDVGSPDKENMNLQSKKVKRGSSNSSGMTQILSDIRSPKTLNNNSLGILIDAISNKATNLNRIGELNSELLKLQNRYEASLSKCNFPIMDGVFGTVFENFKILNSKHREAIEVILGSRLNYIIVDNEEIGTDVIESARRRLNVIPLNKIKSSVDKKKITEAKEFNGVNCLDLIVFDEKFRPAFEYLFGGFYIFESLSDAKKACFQLKIFAVCLDGNVYDPRGTVTGGTKKMVHSQNVTLRDVIELKSQINNINNQINELRKNEKEIMMTGKLLRSLNEYKILNEEIGVLDGKISVFVNLCDDNMDLFNEVEGLKTQLDDKIKTLRSIQREEEKNEQSKRKTKLLHEEYEGIRLQKKSLEDELDLVSAKLRDNEIRKSKIGFLEKDKKRKEERMRHVFSSLSKTKKNITKMLIEKKGLLKNIELEKLHFLAIDNIKDLIIDESFQNSDFITKGEHIEDDFGLHQDLIEIDGMGLIKEHLFESYPIIDSKLEEYLKVRLYNARKDLETLNRPMISMNPKNFEFLEKNEEQINLIETRITKLENDKSRILQKIQQLSEESAKQTALALQHLNKAGHFLRYFINDSDLRIDNEYNLFIKIGNWKDSLTELSGGQKSIVALSLIFAMLNYRPAPFYLFDEIDSALDTSYTQNIGEMIKKEFSYSQFVIISLKEEFYRNANSVFQVHTNDGRVDVHKIK